jgi:hypothetical protein
MTASDVFEIAEAETAAILADDPTRSSDPTLPIYRLAAAERLESEHKRFEAGDRMALLGAIRICANHDMPLPAWASRAYTLAYDTVLTCRAGSWDTVFGTPYKGKHLRKLRQRRALRFAVLNEINRRLRAPPKPPIDVGLFEVVGEQFGIGTTLCGELYYSARRMTSAK